MQSKLGGKDTTCMHGNGYKVLGGAGLMKFGHWVLRLGSNKNVSCQKYRLVLYRVKCGFVLCHFVFNCDLYLNVASFKNHLMSYLCLNIVHILMLFRIFN